MVEKLLFKQDERSQNSLNHWPLRNVKAAHKRYMAKSQIKKCQNCFWPKRTWMDDLFWERQLANRTCYGVVGVFEDNSSEAPDPTEEGSSVTGKLNLDSYRLQQNISWH